MSDELLSLGQAAKELGISRNTIAWLVKSGRLETCRLPPSGRRRGVKRYVRRSDLAPLREGAWRRHPLAGTRPRQTKEGGA